MSDKIPAPENPLALARSLFLSEKNTHGCAETSYIVLKSFYGLANPEDSAAAMALNGGIAYSGGMCGALLGGAMAVGELAASRIEDHRTAKKTARTIMIKTIAHFRELHGNTGCRELTGLDISKEEEHTRFIESGIWRTACMAQIETVVSFLKPLKEKEIWQQAVLQVQS